MLLVGRKQTDMDSKKYNQSTEYKELRTWSCTKCKELFFEIRISTIYNSKLTKTKFSSV